MAILQPFFKSDVAAVSPKKRANSPRRNSGAGGCEACGLYKHCHSPKMTATGDGRKGILIIAEAPGASEDAKGEQLIGKSGQRLRKELKRVGIDLDVDCRKINAVACRPKDNKTPTDNEVACCRHRVMAEIQEFRPTVILALGGPAMKSLAQHRASWDHGFPAIGLWEGEVIPDQEIGAWIVPTWHPAFMLRLDGHPVYERKWRQDLQAVADLAAQGEAPIKEDFASYVEVLISPDAAARRLEALYSELMTRKNPKVVFDYETTGRKPYVEGHRIVSCAFCYDDNKAVSFLMNDRTWPWVERILRHPKIAKKAHNMKFEELWTRVRGNPTKGGFEVKNWAWDSMLASFLLVNRVGKSGLKLQGYLKQGVIGYDTSIAHFLKSSSKDSNALNNIDQAPVRDLLLYGGMDVLLTWRLCEHQEPLINADAGLVEAYDLWHQAAITFVDTEINGIVTDRDYCERQAKHLDKRIAHLRKRVLTYPEVVKWQQMFGDKFNLNSKQQLGQLLFGPNGLGFDAKKLTTAGNASVDKEVLEDLQLSFAKDMVQINKLQKLQGTYLRGFLSEAPDGIMHPFYNLNTVVSFRGSVDSPSFQNIPKRDKESQLITRNALFARDGYLWLEIDYASIEVRIAATYHKDPNMLRYLNDEHSDMHRDMAMQLMFLDEEQVSKYLRNAAKNGFVFAEFYGDWYQACATNMWLKWFNSDSARLKNGTHIYDHLRSKGIKSLEQFIKHVQRVENHFWNKRFPVYGEWREDNWEEYRRKGYMRGHTGFIYNAIMDRKQTSNYGTQGSGFHCLVRSMIEANNKLKREQWKSFVNGQIHDAMEINAHADEINDLLPAMRKIMVDDLMARYSWINCPMDVEFELAPLGQSWANLKQVHHRDKVCDCGLEWGYKDKRDDGKVRWDCPVCSHFDVI